MVDYDFKNGLYPYPLKYLPSDGGIDQTTFIQGTPTVQPNSTNWYVICLTPDELQALRDIINVGAPITYPDSFQKYWKLYAQMEQFPNEIPDNSCMDLCTLIAECISTTPEIQQLIANYSIGSSIEQTTPEQQDILDAQLVNNPAGCDNDIIYGMVYQLVDFINDVNEDILELFVNAPFAMGRLGDLIEAIPGVGILPFDDMLQFTDNFLEDVNDAYQSAYTVSLALEIKCDLFCLAQLNNCVLDYEMARDYFKDKLGETVDTTDFLSFMEDIIAFNLIGNATVYAMFLLYFQTMIFGGEILGQNASLLTNLVNAMYNDPNSDWSIDCPTCVPTWEHTFDFTQNDGGWTAWNFTGDVGANYIANTGWQYTNATFNPTDHRRAVSIQKTFTDTEITEISVTFDYLKGTFDNSGATAFAMNERYQGANVDSLALTDTSMSTGNGQTKTLTATNTCDQLTCFIAACNRIPASWNGDVLITSITVKGTGTDPF